MLNGVVPDANALVVGVIGASQVIGTVTGIILYFCDCLGGICHFYLRLVGLIPEIEMANAKADE